MKLKLGEGIAGHVAQTGESIIANDLMNNPLFKEDISFSIDFPTHSILCVPVKHENKTIGVIEILNKKSDSFNEDDQILLSLVADLASSAIYNARSHGTLKNQINLFKSQIDKDQIFVSGRSAKTQEILTLVEKVSVTDSTVLIYGETGTGKELIARMIHRNSQRRDAPFVCVTCSSIAETLLESELFGHEKGAFTGAIEKKLGKFELAHSGTVFLDEISTIPMNTQVKLLRVLQEKEIERVGGKMPIKVDIRVLAATNENLKQLIKEGKFREDLYYRLKVIEMQLPPLRERKQDIEKLIAHYIQYFSSSIGHRMTGISNKAQQILLDYKWPGNIRELRNIIERAIVLDTDHQLDVDDLPRDLLHPINSQETIDSSESIGKTPLVSSIDSNNQIPTLEEAEKVYIKKVLEYTHGDKSKAARLLNISRNRLSRKIAS